MDQSELFEKYYTKILKFLSYRPRSTKEIKDYLIRKNADEKITEQIITLLQEQKFLDDKEFARMWYENRVRYKPKSLWVITMELRQKGISQEIIDAALNNNNDNHISDEELARQIVDKQITKFKNISKEDLYEKLAGQLGRRGFSWNIIKKILNDYL